MPSCQDASRLMLGAAGCFGGIGLASFGSTLLLVPGFFLGEGEFLSILEVIMCITIGKV